MKRHASPRVLVLVATLGTTIGCNSPSSGAGDTPASASASASPPAVSASAAPPKVPAPPANDTWSGTYTATPGSLYVYDGGEWKGVHFRGDDASIGLGDGPITFTVDGKTHVLRGNASGPLGDVILTGAVTGDEVSFTVLRQDPTDRGFTGTGLASTKDGTLTGTMKLSRGDAHVIRDATFTLTKKAP